MSFSVRRINRELRIKYRLDDDMWPVCGRFSTVNRAARRVRDLRRLGLVIDSAEEYRAVVESELSRIVNDSRNW